MWILIAMLHSKCFTLQICHSRSGDINPAKIRALVDAYVDKARKMRKYNASKQKTIGPGKANGLQRAKWQPPSIGTTEDKTTEELEAR